MGLFSFVTDFFTGGAEGAANKAAQNAVDVLGSAKLPDIEAMKVKLEKQVQQGILTPEMANTILQEQSSLAGYSQDPRLKNAQLDALSGLQDIASNKGLTTADRGQLQDIAAEEAATARGNREAILSNARERGVGGSGIELAAQLGNAQNSATNASKRGFDVAKNAQERALSAMMNSGQLAGNIEGQNFNEQQSIANAKDAINRFNVANQNATVQTNVAAKNTAAEKNLAAKQGVADTNVGLSNQEQVYNKSLLQQQYENEMKKKQALANAYTSQANNAQKNADTNVPLMQNALSWGAETLGFSDENLKTDVKPFDAGEFLDSITGYKYKFKDKSMGKGPHAGVMAQDLEKSPVGHSAVIDTPKGKAVDMAKLQGVVLASLANIHDRLKRVGG